MARVTRLGGTITVATWASTDESPGADMIDDKQYAELLASAQTELSGFVDRSGQVRFAAPALIATSPAA